MFTIPSSRSTKTLFVINKDFYISKDGEFRGNIQALTPTDTSRNKRGFSVVEYTLDAPVYDALGDTFPTMATFESEPRESRNRFGNMTNTDHILKLISLGDGQQPASTTDKPSNAVKG
ncbi:hypothetical protein [Nitrincola alkalisediminis]|uniref:hypothetical protein n=1 Tax=Nitrincola alkalisediminis TaxID=1366656 RepID=UPI00187549C1|nr:hypothetical protein [Nitrincola alkalisediminis]